jgi:hypothetical protein
VSLERDARRTRSLLACGLAPALFVAVVLVEGAIRPGYDPLHHFGSELSLGSGGWIQVTNFIVTGLLVLGNASYHGLVQRFTITLGFGWLSVLALLLLRERPGQPPPQPQPPPQDPVNERGSPNQRPAWSRNANNRVYGKRLRSPYQDSAGREAAR